jgi:hypothetical protein
MRNTDETKRQVLYLQKQAKGFPVPENWETSWTAEEHFVMRNQAGDIELVFKPWGGGTTRFKIGEGWRSFDRTGVSDSFYWMDLNSKRKLAADLKEIVAEQLANVERSRAFHATALKVPMVGFSIAPATLEEHKKRLASHGLIRFTPSGFGTGYDVVTRKPKHNYNVRRANAELETFYDRSPLWVVGFDCD